jgi:hypothetical protein
MKKNYFFILTVVVLIFVFGSGCSTQNILQTKEKNSTSTNETPHKYIQGDMLEKSGDYLLISDFIDSLEHPEYIVSNVHQISVKTGERVYKRSARTDETTWVYEVDIMQQNIPQILIEKNASKQRYTLYSHLNLSTVPKSLISPGMVSLNLPHKYEYKDIISDKTGNITRLVWQYYPEIDLYTLLELNKCDENKWCVPTSYTTVCEERLSRIETEQLYPNLVARGYFEGDTGDEFFWPGFNPVNCNYTAKLDYTTIWDYY